MDCVTGVNMAISMAKLGGFAILPRFDTPEVQAEKVKKIKSLGHKVGASIGIKEGEWHRLELLVQNQVDHINIDVAHGHLDTVIKFVSKVKKAYPNINLSAGVVGTYEAAMDLFNAGADNLKVGVGPGSICTTRIMTGCGVPQFTAISECARAARKMKKIIWADGGVKNSGDIVKCLAAGASAVMVGNVLAGTDETPPKIIRIQGKKYKSYNGSTSLTEKKNQIIKYNLDKTTQYIKHIEGVEGFVPYKGPVKELLEKLVAGIRSGYSYCGAKNTEDLWQKARFVRVTPIGLRENGAHDILQI